jgi:oxygen-independent coproporphyrinogen-3 oxidase
MPDEETAATLFEMTQERLAAHGLPAYEISNHARPGAESRHNLAYWRYEDYLGIGPGAHGRITRSGVKYATRQRRLPEAWLARPDFEETTAIARESAVEETVMMGLRLVEGIPRARLEVLADCSVEALFGIGLQRLVAGGFLALDDSRLSATAAGRQRLNAVLATLFG